MKSVNVLIALLALFIISCNDKDDSTEPDTLPLCITVFDATEWTPENTTPLSSGATILLSSTNNNNEYTQVTNSSGVATFEGLSKDTYEMLVSKNGKYNLSDYDPATDLGFKVIGMFNSQEEVDSYICFGDPEFIIQPNAQPGDLKLGDNNGDCIIDDNDKVNSVTIYLEPRKDLNDDGIINSDDMLNGDYQYYDKLETHVFIGN